MSQQHRLNPFQRSIAFCLAAMVTLSLLGGIDQLAHGPQPDAAWAASGTLVARG